VWPVANNDTKENNNVDKSVRLCKIM
jgi:hypothetical protein